MGPAHTKDVSLGAQRGTGTESGSERSADGQEGDEGGWTVMTKKPNQHQRKSAQAAKRQLEERERRLDQLRAIIRAGREVGPKMPEYLRLSTKAQQTVKVAWCVLQHDGAQSPAEKANTVEGIFAETVSKELSTWGTSEASQLSALSETA